jgi:hypothetical protein
VPRISPANQPSISHRAALNVYLSKCAGPKTLYRI